MLSKFQGSPAAASGAVCKVPPLKDNSAETWTRINSWLDDCLANHDRCRKTLSGAVIDESREPILPTRVLDVGNHTNNQYIKLVETSGRLGQYLALSHCWGPPQKRPLRTIKGTLADHLRGIAVDNLPKTFKDAVTITRGVRVRYLWIDSLRIVQDDKQDWLQESARMGTLYERAKFTIAASGAKDSTEGCVLTERSTLPL